RGLQRDPTRLRARHEMRVLGRPGQFRVDGGRKGMHQFRPARIPEPKRAAAVATEVSLAGADSHIARRRIVQPRPIDRQVLPAGDPEGLVPGAEVDGIAATAGRLSTDRAIAEIERIWMRRFDREANRLAVT